MNRVILFAFLVYYVKTQVNSQLSCPTYACGQNKAKSNSVCFFNTTIFEYSAIQVSQCPLNQYCPINFRSRNITSLNCQSLTRNFWSGLQLSNLVEGDYCLDQSDCSSRLCDQNICKGKSIGTRCSTQYECDSISYCDTFNTNKCQMRKNSNEQCNFDFECKNIYGCFQNQCTQYNSIPSGVNITSLNSYDSLLYCYSGFSINGVCEDLILQNQSSIYCDFLKDECSYTTSISNKNMTLKTFCNCDLSGNGLAYCRKSTNSQEYQKFIKLKMDLLSQGCHYFNKMKCASTNYTTVLNYQESINQLNGVNFDELTCFNLPNVTTNPALCEYGMCIKGQTFEYEYLKQSVSNFISVYCKIIIFFIFLIFL